MAEGCGVRVLIVDDDARVRRALRALLEAEGGGMVGEAASPADALAGVAAFQPQVILLDLLLPTAAAGLALLPRLTAWPVVALSIRGGLREATLAAGAVAFVEKGAPPEAIVSACRAAAWRCAGHAACPTD